MSREKLGFICSLWQSTKSDRDFPPSKGWPRTFLWQSLSAPAVMISSILSFQIYLRNRPLKQASAGSNWSATPSFNDTCCFSTLVSSRQIHPQGVFVDRLSCRVSLLYGPSDQLVPLNIQILPELQRAPSTWAYPKTIIVQSHFISC